MTPPRTPAAPFGNFSALGLFGFRSWAALQAQHAAWADEALRADRARREEAWSSSLAVGRPAFVAEVKAAQSPREAPPTFAADSAAENGPLSLDLAVLEGE